MRYAIPLLLLLGACTTASVDLVNPQTGQTASCGPYRTGPLSGLSAAQREARCIDDYRTQGFVRKP